MSISTKYKVHQWPDLDHRVAMTKKEASDYFEYFMAIKADRVAMLADLVLAETGIRLNYSKKSLQLLHPWCLQQAKIRMFTPKQMEAARADPLMRVAAQHEPLFGLTKRAESIGADLGIYLCECIHKKRPSLKWVQDTSRTITQYCPLLFGLPGSHGVEPIDEGTTYLYRLAEQRKGLELPMPVVGLHVVLSEFLDGTRK